jgi:hypothetical protein
MRVEGDRYACDLASKSNNLLLTVSSGLDSQCMLHSFVSQGIPFESAFLYMPGYNDNEYNHLKIVDKKYGITTQIVDIDPKPLIAELTEEDSRTGIQRLILMQKKFISQLPSSADIVQNAHDPTITTINQTVHYSVNYHSTEVERDRAYHLINRTGKIFFFGDDSEFRYSMHSDPVFKHVIKTLPYTANNGLKKFLFTVSGDDLWDFYIKPLIYGHHWGNELIYFPKFAGHEKLEEIRRPMHTTHHVVNIPYHEYLDHLGSMNGTTNRYYE